MASRTTYEAPGILSLCRVGVSETLWYRVRILTLHRWGVLWLYTHIGYIEEVSTAGISLDQLLELLVDKQLEALIYVGMGRLQVENDDMRGCSRTESDDGQEARSLETIGDVHCHPEHYEGKRERLEGATGLGKVCLEGKIRGSI